MHTNSSDHNLDGSRLTSDIPLERQHMVVLCCSFLIRTFQNVCPTSGWDIKEEVVIPRRFMQHYKLTFPDNLADSSYYMLTFNFLKLADPQRVHFKIGPHQVEHLMIDFKNIYSVVFPLFQSVLWFFGSCFFFYWLSYHVGTAEDEVLETSFSPQGLSSYFFMASFILYPSWNLLVVCITSPFLLLPNLHCLFLTVIRMECGTI